MSKRNATLDASFWINASRASIIGFLSDYFDLFVCQAVIDEVLYPINVLRAPAEGALLFQQWLQADRMTQMEPQRPVDWLDLGENHAAALAIERDYLLLIDDKYAYHFAKSRGVTAFSTPAFVVWLYRDQRLDYDRACLALGRLQAEKKLRRAALVALYQMAEREEMSDEPNRCSDRNNQTHSKGTRRSASGQPRSTTLTIGTGQEVRFGRTGPLVSGASRSTLH